MLEVFETQAETEQRCTLHALNNVLQLGEHFVTYDDFHKIIKKISHDDPKIKKKLRDIVTDTIVTYYNNKKEFGEHDTSYSLSVALEWLTENKIGYEEIKGIGPKTPLNKDFFKKDQNYYLFTKIDKGTSNHAIAIVDGYILDSLEKGKIKFNVNLCTGENPKYSIQKVWKINMDDLKKIQDAYQKKEQAQNL